jgi:hypothetical protein
MARKIPDFELADALKDIDKAFGWSVRDLDPWPVSPETHRSYKRAHRRPSAKTIEHLHDAYKARGGLLAQPPPGAGVWPQAQKQKLEALTNLDALSRRTEVRLSEQLRRVRDDLTRARLLLGKLSRSRSDMVLIDAALEHIDEAGKADLAEILIDLIEKGWDTGFRRIEIAPVVLHRLSKFGLHTDKGRRLIEKVEDAIKDCDRHRVAALEPLCMGAMQQEKDGAFVSHVKLLLESQYWQREDSRLRKQYYGTWDDTNANVFRHISERAVELQSHDVGSVIELAKRRSLNEDQREWLARKMELSLRCLGISVPLIGKFRDSVLLTQRAREE